MRASILAFLPLVANANHFGNALLDEWSQKTEQFRLGLTDHNKDPFTPDFSKYVNEVLRNWTVPGMSIAVVTENYVYAEVGTHPRLFD